MANLLRRWRAPFVGGAAIWLLSFPLLTWHPASASHAVYAQGAAIAQVDAADHRLVRQLERDRAAAQAAEEALAVAASQAAAAPAAPAVQAAPPTHPPVAAPPVAPANTILIPRLGLVPPGGWDTDCGG